jgi:hypothetical protein
MWAIPKVNAQVIVMCIDGDPSMRVFMGCIFTQLTPHTLPHGRWMYDKHPGLPGSGAMPQGPLTSRESAIEPLSTNITQAFGSASEPNYEWRSRAGDYSVAGLAVDQINSTHSKVPDDKNVAYDDWMSTQGYSLNRTDPHAKSSYTDKSYESSVYSITSPGFHAISMDDRQENCRVRIRSTAGHQILLDDTNERIYIASAQGKNWIEMDQDGNIDIFSANKVNVRSHADINFTADETIRLHAGKGIHMYSGGDIRLETINDIHTKSKNVRLQTSESVLAQSDQSVNFKAGSDILMTAAKSFQSSAGTTVNLTSTDATHILASKDVLLTGKVVQTNGTPATAAVEAPTAGTQPAMWTNRVPDHEPFARTMTASDFSHAPEFKYKDPNVNRSERGRTIIRGMYWRR